MLIALVVAGGAAAAAMYYSGPDSKINSVLKLGSAETTGTTATAPLDGRSTAAFELVAATNKVTVKTQDLGDDLYRMTASADSGVRPVPVLDEDQVRLLLAADSDRATPDVEVLLSSKVRWSLRLSGGADEQLIDLTGGQVSRIDVVGGGRRIELSLPKPAGTVPVRVTGAIEDLSVRSPVGSPVRIQLDSGAKTVAAGERTLRDVRPGSTLTPKNWQVKDRYDVDTVAWVTLLSVENAGTGGTK
jgi:hypothetical protein